MMYILIHSPKKILYEELRLGKRSLVVRRSDTRIPSKPPLRRTNRTLEQIAQIEQSGFIRRDAGEYEAKRIRKSEQERAKRKTRAKASPTEISALDRSCSICNRQFRA